MNRNNDIDYLNLILDYEKSISNNYALFLNESSNDYLYENVFSMMEDSYDMAREIYNFMLEKDFFKIEEISDDKRISKIDYFNSIIDNL